MALKVIVDEDLPRRAVQLLQERGYDAAGVVEQGMGGWKDAQLWVAIQKAEQYYKYSNFFKSCRLIYKFN